MEGGGGDRDRAIAAINRFLLETHAGRTFPSDEIWNYCEGEQPAGSRKPSIIISLEKSGYIAKTGGTARAVSGLRKGSPTTEYTFGPEVCPESLRLAKRALDGSDEDTEDVSPISYVGLPPNKAGEKTPHDHVQRLVHGCPGSGKSYRLERDSKRAHRVFRTVFHPETRYSDFVGGLRPVSIYRLPDAGDPPAFAGSETDVPGEPYVHYIVQPGPLLKAYHVACLRPEWSVVVVVEELSRAVAAHVFGDMIQLLDRLDREEDGVPPGYSEYEIDPRPDIRDWLLMHEIGHPHVTPGHIRFPANLYIWATMNRSDQNARQLDSAFLRRWRKEYLSYLIHGANDRAHVKYGGKELPWGVLRGAINERLKGLDGVPEDKFIGPYFLSRTKLADPEAVAEDLWGHLWNDVLKARAPQFFEGATTYAELLELWEDGEGTPIGDVDGGAS